MASSADIYHEGENIYVNLSLYNNQDAQNNAAIDVALEKPIVEKANDYKLSIIRFTCPLTTVPRYSLNNINFTVDIYYSNVHINGWGSATVPNTPLNSISDFISLLNAAFSVAYSNFVYYIGEIGKTLPTGYSPYFLYNPQTRLMAFVVPKYFLDGSILPLPVSICVSNDIYGYIYGFPSVASEIPGYTNLRINSSDYNIYTSPQYPSTNQSAYINYQEFPTDYEFNDLQSVIIGTSLPVRNEFIPLSTNQPSQPIVTGSSGISYISSIPVLTDYIVPVEQFGQQNQRIYYIPTGEFRWTDLIYSLAIDRLSFTFYYQTSDQNIHPLLIEPGEYVSIKILLRRLVAK